MMMIFIVVGIFSVIVNVMLIKSNIEKSKTIKDYRKNSTIMQEIEIEKNKIRTKYDDKKNAVLNGTTDNDTKLRDNKRHNHDYSDTCGKSCPLYSGDRRV